MVASCATVAPGIVCLSVGTATPAEVQATEVQVFCRPVIEILASHRFPIRNRSVILCIYQYTTKDRCKLKCYVIDVRSARCRYQITPVCYHLVSIPPKVMGLKVIPSTLLPRPPPVVFVRA